MKTIFKVILAAALAVAAAFVVRGLYLLSADNTPENSAMDAYQELLLTARAMFVEKADDIQMLTMALLPCDDVSILSDSEGQPWIVGKNGEKQRPEDVLGGELQPYLENVFGSYDCGGQVLNLRVTDRAVLFFTGYHSSGGVGFLYERELGEMAEFTELLELSENWKIFYHMSEE